MSRRFKIGERFIKKSYAGFIGEACLCVIPDEEENRTSDEPCFTCDDPHCNDWPTLHVIDETGKYLGMACHVSECEMEFVENKKEEAK